MAQAVTVGIDSAALKNRLKNGEYCGAYLFCGEEEYLKDTNLGRFRKLIADSGMAEMNIARLDFAEENDFEALSAELSALPMMSDYRLVEISGINFNSMKAADEKAFMAAVSNLPDGVIAVFRALPEELVIDKKTIKKKIIKSLCEAMTVVYFERLNDRDLAKWARKELAADGITIDDDAISELTAITVSDMCTMAHELQKLSMYVQSCGRKEIIRQDVNLNVEGGREYAFFLLGDAILSGNGERTIEIILSLKRQREEPIPLVAAIARSIGNVQIAVSGVSNTAALKAAGLADWQVKKLKEQAYGLRRDFFVKAEELCLECDRRQKSEGHDGYLLLETLAMQLSSLVKSSRRTR